jgi:hypothetical protein
MKYASTRTRDASPVTPSVKTEQKKKKKIQSIVVSLKRDCKLLMAA